uniref:Uncharacterized protein LOC8286754 n=1 Tax=Rhizophora mucronata TaxID=61149 RepID=A0A2P2ME49_RHIMU
MAEGKLDLPEDLLSSKPSDHSWTLPKVISLDASGVAEGEKAPIGLHDDSKDQLLSESSIPLSPQWLYTKPSDAKMDMRAPTSVSLGNSNDPNQKDGWRMDGSEDKKDWRRTAPDSEGSRRWREEERETGLLGARRDRRKTDRRADGVSIRETVESRVLSSSDRWHDGGNRNSGHEARRDSKWTSRWGPEDKDKEPRINKKADAEKEKEDVQNDNQSSMGSSRATSERDSDTRDKWRPRHRMEVHSGGSGSYRAAPGFGPERGCIEGPNLGFTFGRGRANAIGRSSSAATVSTANSHKNGIVIGKPNISSDTFCYPRGKLLNIYRTHKLDSSFSMIPDHMDESPPITQEGFIEPMAFVAPDAEEEAILSDIWKGKITSSGVVYSAFKKGKSTENIPDAGESESTEEKQDILSLALAEEATDTLQEAASEYVDRIGVPSLWNEGANINELNEKVLDREEGENKGNAYGFTASVVERDNVCNAKEISITSQANIVENLEMLKPAFIDHIHSNPSMDVKAKLPDDSSSLFVPPSSEQVHGISLSHLAINSEQKDQERVVAPEDLYFYYIDPHGNIQGPFLGADIILWFEEGYFGTELLVRLADAPEGTPFQNLGEVMPHLKLRVENASNELGRSGSSGGKLDLGLPLASIPDTIDSSAVNDLHQPLSELSSFASQCAQSRMSETEDPVQLPHSEGQSFHDFVAQDEEIVFPGRPSSAGYSQPSSAGYPTVKSSGNLHDPLSNMNSHQPHPNELMESGLPHQKDNKLHPFGLFWSELEGSHGRQSELLDTPASIGRAVAPGVMTDQSPVNDKWTDTYRHDVLPVTNSFQDAISARHLSHTVPEPNHFDLAEQLMSRQFQQQQVQQHNMLSSHARLNELLLEHVPAQSLIHHQQLANQPAADLEHLLALRLQQQRQLQLQHHQLQQQQQFHHQQKLLQERQQSHARQALLEHLLHGQIPESGLLHTHVDPLRANSVLDQAFLEQKLLQELQQQTQHPLRHLFPSVDQLTQAKFGHAAQHEQQRDLFEMLSHGNHGQAQALEQQILQEQLQARQLSMGLRQRRNLEDERRIDPVWPINENDHLLGSFSGSHRAQSSGISPLDFYQRQQRLPHEDQPSQLERNLSFQDRPQPGMYEPGSVPFERSLSLSAGASGMNMDVVNPMAHAHGMREFGAHMQSAGQVGGFPSGIQTYNSHHPMVPNEFHIAHMDANDGQWLESNGQLTNDWMESGIQQPHINAERQKKESDIKITVKDPTSWMSDGLNDDKSRRLLMELLHQKASHQPVDPLNINGGLSFDKSIPHGPYPRSSSSDHPFGVIPGHEADLNNSFAVGSYGSNASEPVDLHVANEQPNNMEVHEKLPFKSESRLTCEGPFLLGINETNEVVFTDSGISDKALSSKDYLEVEGRRRGSKNVGMAKGSGIDTREPVVEQVRLAAADRVEKPVNTLSQHSSLSVAGFFDDKIGPQNSFAEDIGINQVHAPSRVQENILLRRAPVSRASSSQEGLPELVSDTAARAKVSLSITDVSSGVNQASQANDISGSGKNDARFRRTSSCGDTDVSEPSFIDMLKSNAKKIPTAELHAMGVSESSDSMQGGKSSKKKGKKGRQIDPALLGFKVTSNRIMMGEIQRIED